MPTEEAAAASVAMHQATRQPPPPDDPFPEFSVFDDRPPSDEPFAAPPARQAPPAIAEDDLPPAPPRRKSSKQKKPQPPKHPQQRDDRPTNGRTGSSEERPPPKQKRKTTPTPPARPSGGKPVDNSGPTTVPGGIIKSAGASSSYSDLLLITRRTLYFQAVLICIIGLAGLLGGFLIGRSLGPTADGGDQGNEAVEIIGTLTYRTGQGNETPDFGAVALALPVDRPGQLRGLDRLGPHTPRKKEDDPVTRVGEAAIEEIGGAHGRTDGLGGFTLNLPAPGRYYLLFISKNATRPQGTPIDPKHLEQLRAFTDNPATLIGASKYVWVMRDVNDPRLAVTHSF